MEINGETWDVIFENQSIDISGKRYCGCKFTRCLLTWRKGEDAFLKYCHFDDSVFEGEGWVENGITIGGASWGWLSDSRPCNPDTPVKPVDKKEAERSRMAEHFRRAGIL